MKKIILILLILNIFFIASITNANAENYSYSRILDEETALYSDLGETVLFILPYSYYVKVINVGATYTYVSYQDNLSKFPLIYGYILSEKLNICENVPNNPYPKTMFSVKESATLFDNYSNTNSTLQIILNSDVLHYYGSVTYNNEEYLCVYTSDNFGYIKKNKANTFILPPHPDKIETKSPPSDGSELDDLPKKTFALNEGLQIVIILGISVIVISIVYLLFKPSGDKLKDQALSNLNNDE